VGDDGDPVRHRISVRVIATAAIVSFRLGGTDGVAVEAAKWAWALRELGWTVTTVAGEGPVDRLVPALAIGATVPLRIIDVREALAGADLVVVENAMSLPLNVGAATALAAVLRGRPAVLHHHDLPWQRPLLGNIAGPEDDPAWAHVTVNDLSRRELAERGIEATTIRNTFDPDPKLGDRDQARAAAGVGTDAMVVLQPTRAIPRKRVGAGLRLAEALGATFWLTGPAEEGFGSELDALLAGAAVPVVRRAVPDVADAYAAADLVVLPSSWEGFGNPAVEAALHGRPAAVGPYPVADELRALGFRWADVNDPASVRIPDDAAVAANRAAVGQHLCLHDLPERLGAVVAGLAV
jgi:glycosyltransferase involved in cell wall biosynthesis